MRRMANAGSSATGFAGFAWTDSHSRYRQVPIVESAPAGSEAPSMSRMLPAENREAECCSEVKEGDAAAAKDVGADGAKRPTPEAAAAMT